MKAQNITQQRLISLLEQAVMEAKHGTLEKLVIHAWPEDRNKDGRFQACAVIKSTTSLDPIRVGYPD